jgi:hypothetical protein
MENLELKKCKTCGFKGEISFFWKEVRKTCVSYNHCKECFLKKRRATDKRAYKKRSKEISAKKAAKSKIKRANEREIKKSTIEIICCIKCNDQFQKRKLSRTERKYFLLCEICKKFEKKIIQNIYNKENSLKEKEKIQLLGKVSYNQEKLNTENKIISEIKSKFRMRMKNMFQFVSAKIIFEKLLYSPLEFKKYIELQFEPWMSWNNWSKYYVNHWNDNDQSTWVWHLDHIIPHSEFEYNSMDDEEFKKCWSLNNLRPYSAKQNIIDGSTKIRHKKKEK